jgi:hypothetical protein
MVILLLRNLHWYLQLAAGSRHSGRRVLPTQLDQVESIETIRWCADLPRLPRVRILSRPKPAPNPRLCIVRFGHQCGVSKDARPTAWLRAAVVMI